MVWPILRQLAGAVLQDPRVRQHIAEKAQHVARHPTVARTRETITRLAKQAYAPIAGNGQRGRASSTGSSQHNSSSSTGSTAGAKTTLDERMRLAFQRGRSFWEANRHKIVPFIAANFMGIMLVLQFGHALYAVMYNAFFHAAPSSSRHRGDHSKQQQAQTEKRKTLVQAALSANHIDDDQATSDDDTSVDNDAKISTSTLDANDAVETSDDVRHRRTDRIESDDVASPRSDANAPAPTFDTSFHYRVGDETEYRSARSGTDSGSSRSWMPSLFRSHSADPLQRPQRPASVDSTSIVFDLRNEDR